MPDDNELMDINALFTELQHRFKKTTSIRKKVIKQLMAVVDDITLTGDDKASMIEAKMGIIKTLDDILKSDENNHTGLIKTMLYRQETESNANAKDAAVAMLREINMHLVGKSTGAGIIAADNIDSTINDLFSKTGEVISQDELSQNEE